MELKKGQKIFIVRLSGNEEEVLPFLNYDDAKRFADDKIAEFKNEMSEDGEEDMETQVLGEEQVENNSPITHVPYSVSVRNVWNGEEFYVEIINEKLIVDYAPET